MKQVQVATLFTTLVTIGLGASPAAACFDACMPPSVTVGEQVPANAPGFHVDADTGSDAPRYVLKRVDVDEVISLKRVGDTLMPETPLVLHAQYVLRTIDVCDGVEDVMEQHFVVVSAAAPPEWLGVLDVTATDQIDVVSTDEEGFCVDERLAGVEVALSDSPDLYFWGELMDFELIVDGEPWTPAVAPAWTIDSETRELRSAIYASCEGAPDFAVADGVASGEHRVVARAHLPGSNIVVESEPLDVVVHCQCPDGQFWNSWAGACDYDYPADDYYCSASDGYAHCPADYIDEPLVSCSTTSAPASGLSGFLAAIALLLLRRRRP
jgi:MYXO-CTERM domain-containing protein